MRPDDPTVMVEDIVCIKETAKALLIEPATESEEPKKPNLWIPKSQVHSTSQVNIEGDVGRLVISRWIFEQKRAENNGNGWQGFSCENMKIMGSDDDDI